MKLELSHVKNQDFAEYIWQIAPNIQSGDQYSSLERTFLIP